MTWHEIHQHTLRALTGISQEDATRLFAQPVHITIDPEMTANRTYQWAAWFAYNLLVRAFPNTTIALTPPPGLPIHPMGTLPSLHNVPTVTLHFGSGSPTPARIIANCHDWHIIIDEQHTPRATEPWNPVLALLTGAYAASRATNLVLERRREPWRPFSMLDFQTGTASFDWDASCPIGTAHLAGVGAVGTAALYAMAVHGRASGTLRLVDDDMVEADNLRYALFTAADVGHPKIQRAALPLRAHCPALTVLEVVGRFEPYFKRAYAADRTFRIERLLMAPDQRATRRAFQNLFPRQVWDASTGPDQVVLHHNSYAPDEACAACIYAPIQEEDAQERHIAEVIHVPLARVKSHEPITPDDAAVIHAAYPHLPADELVGRAFDSVFRRVCGEGKIQIANVEVLAPLPFISAIAGVLLYLEFVKTLSPALSVFQQYNYTQLDPRRPPNPAFRLQRRPLGACRE